MISKTLRDWRFLVMLAVAVIVIVAVSIRAPILQDQAYHAFADGREWLGLPNFWNVVSNAPFLIFGVWGLFAAWRRDVADLPLRTAWITFFVGSALVAFGSAYYHWQPMDLTLVWDRLPMTIAFMAFFALILGLRIKRKLGERSLWPLLLVGLTSVLWWKYADDLRPYLLVQFLPILLIPMILLLFRGDRRVARYVWAVLGVYVMAKCLETFDQRIYDVVGISGHTLKHIAAAFGVYFVLRAIGVVDERSAAPT